MSDEDEEITPENALVVIAKELRGIRGALNNLEAYAGNIHEDLEEGMRAWAVDHDDVVVGDGVADLLVLILKELRSR